MLWSFLAGVATQAAWGAYPAICRYLQVLSPHPIPTFRLKLLITIIAASGLFALNSVPQALISFYKQVLGRPHATPLASLSHRLVDSERRPAAVGKLPRLNLTRAQCLVTCAAALTVLALGNLAAVRFTSAVWCQLILLTTPLITVPLSVVWLGETIPRSFTPAVLLSSLGAAMIIVGLSTSQAGKGADLGVSSLGQNVIGWSISFLGAAALAVFSVLLEGSTELHLTEVDITWASYYMQGALCTALTLPLEGTDWSGLLNLNATERASLVFASIGVFVIANIAQQVVIRRIGASSFTMLLTVRPMAAAVGSHFLGEGLGGPLEVAGFVLVICTMTWFLWVTSSSQDDVPGGAAGDLET